MKFYSTVDKTGKFDNIERHYLDVKVFGEKDKKICKLKITNLYKKDKSKNYCALTYTNNIDDIICVFHKDDCIFDVFDKNINLRELLDETIFYRCLLPKDGVVACSVDIECVDDDFTFKKFINKTFLEIKTIINKKLIK